MRSPALLAVLLCACTPAPFIVLQFPDRAAESDAADMTVYALAPRTDCLELMKRGKPDTWILSVTAKLPLDENAHLGKLTRGPAVFFAEVRDANGLAFLRGCQAATSGGEVLIVLQRVVKPLRMREGEVLEVSTLTLDASGAALKLELRDAPRFVKLDAAANVLHLAPRAADQGTFTFLLAPTEAVAGAFTQAIELTVDDVPRPLKWDRIYRGWHGRFDAAALWDPRYRQLFTTGGRDMGIDLSKPTHTLFTSSNAPDVLTDYRVLSFPGDGGTPDWRPNTFSRTSTTGKYGHVMGWVREQQGGQRIGFILGGSDGSQVSAESLIFQPAPRITFANVPSGVASQPMGAAYHLGMATAIEPDFRATWLFGGDLGLSGYTNELLEITATDPTHLEVKLRSTSFPKPSTRSYATLTLAQGPKRLVVIGGHNTDLAQELLDDAWVICLEEQGPKCPAGSLNVWVRVQNTGDTFPGWMSPGVFGHVAGYDAPNDRVITYGGLGVSNNQIWLFEDAFALELGSSVPDGGMLVAPFRKLPPPGGPLGLVSAAAAYDADGGRLLLYGGLSGRVINGTAQLDMLEDVWSLGLSPGEEKLTKISTAPVYVVPSRRVAGNILSRGPLMLGGQGEGFDPLDEWLIHPDGGATPVTTPGATPLPRANMSAVYNPDLDEYWMYGGRVGQLLPAAALFRYQADAGFRNHEQLDFEPRWGQASVWDERNHRMLAFGGIGISGGSNSTSLNDVVSLQLQNDTLVTTVLAPQGSPPAPRYGAIAGYDRAGQRMLIFGGTATQVAADVDSVDIWELSLVPGEERWRQLEVGGTPPEPMYLTAGAWTFESPPQLYVLGTVKRADGKYTFVDDLWRVKLDAAPVWVKLFRPDFRPRPRVFPGFIYDDVEHKLMLSGGAADPVFRHDVWSLTLP